MNIQINEEYRITSDQHNIILNKKMQKKEDSTSTEDTYRQIAFYPNLEQACVGILNKGVKANEVSSLQELAELMGTLTVQIVAAVKERGQTK